MRMTMIEVADYFPFPKPPKMEVTSVFNVEVTIGCSFVFWALAAYTFSYLHSVFDTVYLVPNCR